MALSLEILSLILTVALHFPATDGFPLSAASGKCTSVVSGAIEKDMVKSVLLNCQEGELRWQHPEGAMLVRLQPPRHVQVQDVSMDYQLCWRFKDVESVGAKATVIRNRVLQKSQDVIPESPIQCEPYKPTSRLSLYIVSEPLNPNTNNHLSLVYEFVRTSRDTGNSCGDCTDEAFVKAYCASDFVFQGSLLRMGATDESMEYSVTTIKRRPTSTADVLPRVAPRSSLQTAVLRCTDSSSRLSGTLHVESVVVATTRLGLAVLQCSIPMERFGSIAAMQNGLCEVR